jgi:hypothetical protein
VKLAEDAVANAKTAPEGKKKKATSSNSKTKKVSDVEKLEEALSLVDSSNSKTAVLKAIVNKLKSKASAEDIAKLLK